ncbi:MAG: sulfotransferase domain-containing protein [Rhizomicrobium sp.]
MVSAVKSAFTPDLRDQTAIAAAFAQPDPDGRFSGAFGAYLKRIGAQRKAIIFVFPPKAAGTFLRTAAIAACDGQLLRIVHAQGGRDAQPYLPLLIDYFTGGLTPKTLVSHIHMQALPANRYILDAFGIRPIIMLRSIPDMLASYWDMLDSDMLARQDGLNCLIPENFPELSKKDKAEFCIDMLAPWYASFYATWLEYAAREPKTVLLLHYAKMRADPAGSLAQALAHAGIDVCDSRCRQAADEAWNERHELRFNKGETGRGQDYFGTSHLRRLERLLSYYPILTSWREQLMGVVPGGTRHQE